jgi:small subunit ribosomal protein S4
MSRYRGSSYKQARRVGMSLLENGKELARKPYTPGQHGQDRKRRASAYSVQLKEKQKVRFMYGLNERQFKKTYNEAGKIKGLHSENFLKTLESRLDNLVYRIGFASTRRGSRQLVNHGHILVNDQKVDIPSYRCKPGDVITLKANYFENKAVKESLEKLLKRVEFITFDDSKMAGTFVRLPERSELNPEINESLIIEFYNR